MFSLNWKAPQGSYIYMLFLSCCFCITKPIVVEPSEIRPSLTYLLTPLKANEWVLGGGRLPCPSFSKERELVFDAMHKEKVLRFYGRNG